MAYGTPASPDDVEAYYTHIRRGRAPSTDQLAELTRRYAAIGGVSPLAERTRDQVAAIATALDADGSGRWAVALGNKHAPPFVEEAVAELAGSAPDDLVGLVLAPHYSRASVGEYHDRAAAAAVERGLAYVGIDAWHDEPAWLDAQADRVRAALAQRCPPRPRCCSPPTASRSGCSSTTTLTRTSCGPRPPPSPSVPALDPWYGWALAWQSAGRTPEPWRGPDVLDVIRDLAATGRAEGVLVCPQGFVSDHLEVLYDLDIDARRVATESGLAFARTASINDDPAVMAALAERVRRAIGGRADRRPGRPSDPVTRRVDLAVVGGGISGLAAAWAGMQQGADVVVLEAGDAPGGKLRTSPVAGVGLDEGADAFLARVPEAVDLCEQLGLGAELVSPATGTAYVWSRGGATPAAVRAAARCPHGPRRRGGLGDPVGRRRRAGARRSHRPRGRGPDRRRGHRGAGTAAARRRGARPAGGTAPGRDLGRRLRPAVPAGRRRQPGGRPGTGRQPDPGCGRGPRRGGRARHRRPPGVPGAEGRRGPAGRRAGGAPRRAA